MEAKHTPGSMVVREDIGGNRSDIYAESGRYVASVSHSTEGHTAAENRANAHLLASAPDLLAALEEIIKMFDKAGLESFIQPDVDLLDQARAALAKAKGEDHA